jgi:hypothetical protein
MDAELKAKWLEALRSGKYDQTSGQLRDGNCFCCLGVLCDIFNPKGWDGAEWIYGEGPDESHETGVLPRSFRVRCAIEGDIEARLIEMNDDGVPFSRIADYIEAKL